jgi:hypothetical protein
MMKIQITELVESLCAPAWLSEVPRTRTSIGGPNTLGGSVTTAAAHGASKMTGEPLPPVRQVHGREKRLRPRPTRQRKPGLARADVLWGPARWNSLGGPQVVWAQSRLSHFFLLFFWFKIWIWFNFKLKFGFRVQPQKCPIQDTRMNAKKMYYIYLYLL